MGPRVADRLLRVLWVGFLALGWLCIVLGVYGGVDAYRDAPKIDSAERCSANVSSVRRRASGSCHVKP